MFRKCVPAAFAIIASLAVASHAHAQTAGAAVQTELGPALSGVAPPSPAVNVGVKTPADYVIGVDDALEVVYWQDKDMSAAVVVRPDGNISLPLLNEIRAAGLTPEQLRANIAEAAAKFVEGPTVSVVIKAVNSRKVFVTGQVGKPGSYPLTDSTTVLQMLATAGGLNEYAKAEKVTIIRHEDGKDLVFKFNYKNVSLGKSLQQNIALNPGDTIVVP
jgi:polysaccharide export outer membrane protein